MKIIETPIPNLLIIEPAVYFDNRGFMMEVYNQKSFESLGITERFVQDNVSKSSYGVVRGLHYQQNPYSQAKLAHVVSGRVFDVAVDLRLGSPTYGQWYGIELSADNKRMFYIPRGFAHGLSVLEDDTIFSYMCDNPYRPESEGGILFSDSDLNIDWHLPREKMIVSSKDEKRPLLKEFNSCFTFNEV